MIGAGEPRGVQTLTRVALGHITGEEKRPHKRTPMRARARARAGAGPGQGRQCVKRRPPLRVKALRGEGRSSARFRARTRRGRTSTAAKLFGVAHAGRPAAGRFHEHSKYVC
jgi:hypothetical protein